jgi:hypothetical protein
METMKEDIAKAVMVFLDLEKEDLPELMKLKIQTLNRIFEGQRKNALAYQHMNELSKKK